MGRTFGNPEIGNPEIGNPEIGNPENSLLVSLRSGALVSMPGMMDSVLNLGLSDEVVEGLARQTGNPRVAYDAYRRLVDMCGDVVVGINRDGLGELVNLGTEGGRRVNPGLFGRDLRRTRWRAGIGSVLPRGRSQLRVV